MRYIPSAIPKLNEPLNPDSPEYLGLLSMANAIGAHQPHTALYDDGSRFTRDSDRLPKLYREFTNIEFQPF